jgi:hypothetical protein
MKLAMVLALAACQSAADDFPVAGGGGGGPVGVGGGGGGKGDAGTGDAGDGDAGVPVTGRVCVLKDLRQLALCDDTKDASHLLLTLGTRPPVALSTLGVFSISAALGTDLTWHVTGSLGAAAGDLIVPTVMAFGTENIIPVISSSLYSDFLGSTHVVLADQEGSIVVRVVNGVNPAVGVKATTTRPTTNGETFYDGSTPLNWLPDTVTGALGIVWFPDVPLANTPPTTALIGLGVPLGAPPVTAAAAVENGAITFVTKDIH